MGRVPCKGRRGGASEQTRPALGRGDRVDSSARDAPDAGAPTLDDAEREVDARPSPSPETHSPSSFIEPSRLPSPSAPSPRGGVSAATEGGWAPVELKARGRARAPQPDSEPEAPHPQAGTAAQPGTTRAWKRRRRHRAHAARPHTFPSASLPDEGRWEGVLQVGAGRCDDARAEGASGVKGGEGRARRARG